VLARGTDTDAVTDTIGWGAVDDPPRRRPRVRLTRRRRIALVVVAALVAGGVLAWPSFRSWRADLAAREIQVIWERAQGFDTARVLTLSGTQQRLGILDGASFAEAVAAIEREEAGDLDNLVRQAKAVRTWTADVAAARTAVVTAMRAQAAALRTQAGRTGILLIDLPITTSIDDRANATADVAATKIDALRRPHHLKAFTPLTEHLHSAATVLAVLHRPTDQLLHLQLVTAGVDGVTVTDLDTGKVLVRRSIDSTDPSGWQPERVLGHSLVGSVDAGTLIIPLTPNTSERVVANTYVQSSTGSPMWLATNAGPDLEAVDESGRPVATHLRLPAGAALTGMGTGSVLLVSNSTGDFVGQPMDVRFSLIRPGSTHRIALATTGCTELPGFGAGLVAIPTGEHCDYSSRLEVFDLSGRLVRTARLPRGEVTGAAPVCSPDGKHVALVATTGPPDPDQPQTMHLRLLDITTGSWTTADDGGGWIPLGWSSDGKTLLVQLIDNARFTPGQQFGQLAYLRLGDPHLHSIRVGPDLSNYLN
jgi:hypothetical protein